MRLTTLILTLLCASCNMRISSEKRFEANIGFALPADKKVLKDEYQDMGQDYAIIYEVELSNAANQSLTERIKPLVSEANKECNWLKADNGYDYMCNKERTTYKVSYDTLIRKISYEELAD
jgi:hypothetical protein